MEHFITLNSFKDFEIIELEFYPIFLNQECLCLKDLTVYKLERFVKYFHFLLWNDHPEPVIILSVRVIINFIAHFGKVIQEFN
jgi:hypothetical protein